MGTMSRHEGEMKDVCQSPILFVVNGIKAITELSSRSGNNRAVGQATHSIHYQGWILHFHTTGSCVRSLNTQIINVEKKIMFLKFSKYVQYSHTDPLVLTSHISRCCILFYEFYTTEVLKLLDPIFLCFFYGFEKFYIKSK